MERYGGDKNLVLVDGDHNTARPRFLYDSVGIFLQQTLQVCVCLCVYVFMYSCGYVFVLLC